MPIRTCRTCGTYFDDGGEQQRVYCGSQCAIRYRRCHNCGGYFAEGEGYRGVCSRACAEHFDEPISAPGADLSPQSGTNTVPDG